MRIFKIYDKARAQFVSGLINFKVDGMEIEFVPEYPTERVLIPRSPFKYRDQPAFFGDVLYNSDHWSKKEKPRYVLVMNEYETWTLRPLNLSAAWIPPTNIMRYGYRIIGNVLTDPEYTSIRERVLELLP